MKFFFIKKLPGSPLRSQQGFLLVELIVAIFIFSIVMTVAVGSVILAFDANKKTQSLESVMNNLNLAMDEMTRSLAVGSDYVTLSTDPSSIQFESQNGETIIYTLENLGGESGGYISRKIDSDPKIRMTAREINIQPGSYFAISGEQPFNTGDVLQPRVSIFIKGLAKAGSRNDTEFYLQTLVSQRINDSRL